VLGNLGTPVAVYRLDAQPRIPGTVLFSLLYPDFVFPQGQDGVLDGTTSREDRASVLWWDGFRWRRLGGAIDSLRNTITARLGFFSYMAIVPAAPISPQDRRPFERIITPNGDGVNDTAVFSLGDVNQNVRVQIFDATGHRVRTLNSLNTIDWDGRDDGGRIVESGVYIYQYEVDGQLVSGLIAVAK
jgi:gliding motility-associated-like protein